MSQVKTGEVTVTLPSDLSQGVAEIARRRRQTSEQVVCDACRNYVLRERRDELDEQYARGYQEVPEDVTELNALMPHLPLSPEDWS